MVRVKVCGMTNLRDAKAACLYGADAIGFVFAASPRKVEVSEARAIIKELPPYIVTVGVFVNEKKEQVAKIAGECNLVCLQFHGDESPAYCDYFRDKYKIIKVIRVRGKESFNAMGEYKVHAFLLDKYLHGKRGGTGLSFDWGLALKAKFCSMPIILAGGITVENVEDAIRKVIPYAVDVSSGTEACCGKKDHKLMKLLIEKVHNCPI